MRLSEFPWVVVRLDCKLCPRRGQYRLARVAAMVGDPEMDLEEVLRCVAHDCPWMHRSPPRRYDPRCGIRFTDLCGRGGPPPDLPPAIVVRLRVVGGRDEPT